MHLFGDGKFGHEYTILLFLLCCGYFNVHGAAGTYRLKETEQGFLVPLPFWVKLGLGGEFVTAELHCDLQTVCVQVIEVRHTCMEMCTFSSKATGRT